MRNLHRWSWPRHIKDYLMLCRAIVLHHNCKGIPHHKKKYKIKKNNIKEEVQFLQPNYNVLQEIEWEMNVFPVWPVAAWTNDTFMQLLMRLHFHRFMFRQWCVDDFDFICNVWVNLSIICIFLPLSVAPVTKPELNQKRKISVDQPWKLLFFFSKCV